MSVRVGEPLSLGDVVAVARGARVELAGDAVRRIAAARAVVEDAVASDATVYGVTTGFGSLATVRVDIGEPIPTEGLGRDGRHELAKRAHEAVAALLAAE